MEITEEQKKIVQDAVLSKFGDDYPTCPISGDGNWSIQTRLAYIMAEPVSLSASESYPSVVLICQTCGYTAFLNVFVLGIADHLELKPAQEE